MYSGPANSDNGTLKEKNLCDVMETLMKCLTRSWVLLYGIYLGLFLLSEACIFLDVRGEDEFKKYQIENIQPGKTTRPEILQWFGPPAAIARRDGKFISRIPANEEDSEEISSQAFFGKFSQTNMIGKNHMIYYYIHRFGTIKARAFQVNPVEPFIDKLWILINQESGRVEDYVFMKDTKIIRKDTEIFRIPFFDIP